MLETYLMRLETVQGNVLADEDTDACGTATSESVS